MFEGCTGCCFGTALIVLLCLGLAVCGVIYVISTSPEPPLTDRFVANPAEAAAFNAQIDQATRDATFSGGFTLTFTERQISSWLALEGESFAQEHGFSFPFENVQMGLADGQMIFYGELGSGRARVPLKVTLVPEVDRVNHLNMRVESVDFVGLKLPGALIDDLADQLEQKMIQPIEDAGADYYLDPNSLQITGGRFTVRGQVWR